jgi:hypothetical protein
MPCLIQGVCTVVDAAGVAHPVANVTVTAKASELPTFTTEPGSMQVLNDPDRSVQTDNAGLWSFSLTRPAEFWPTNREWIVTMPDGLSYVGAVPDVAGPVTLYVLLTQYGWRLASNKVRRPISIQGRDGTIAQGTVLPAPGPTWRGKAFLHLEGGPNDQDVLMACGLQSDGVTYSWRDLVVWP